MEKIDLGHVEVISRTTQIELRSSGPVILNQAQIQPKLIPPEEVNGLVGFKVWQPMYLISARFKLDRVYQFASPSAQSREVIGTVLKYKDSTSRWVVIGQFFIPKVKDGKARLIVPFSIQEGVIKDRPVAFFNHTVEAQDSPNGQIDILHCFWERADFLIELQSHGLSLQEIARVGES